MNSRCKEKLLQSVSILSFLLNRFCMSLSFGLIHILASSTAINLTVPGKAPGLWHMILPTAKLLGHSLARFWPGPTTALPNDLQPRLQRGNAAEIIPRRALAGSHRVVEKQSPHQHRGRLLEASWPQCPGMFPGTFPPPV